MPPIIERFQLHAVVVDHAVGGDHFAAAVDKQQSRFITVQTSKRLANGTATVDIHIVGAANSLQIRKVCDDRGLLAVEGQVDEIFDASQFQFVGHGLKLGLLAFIEAVQPLCQVVQLVHIDRRALQTFENGIPAVQLYDMAVLPQYIAYVYPLQQLHRVIILLLGDGERDRNDTMLRVHRITQNSSQHVLSLPIRMASGPYRAVTAAQRISRRVSSLTNSGSASSSDVAPNTPEQIPFAAR